MHTHTRTEAPIHPHERTHPHPLACTQTHLRTCMCACPHTHGRAWGHPTACTHARTHARMHANTHTPASRRPSHHRDPTPSRHVCTPRRRYRSPVSAARPPAEETQAARSCDPRVRHTTSRPQGIDGDSPASSGQGGSRGCRIEPSRRTRARSDSSSERHSWAAEVLSAPRGTTTAPRKTTRASSAIALRCVLAMRPQPAGQS